MNYYDLLIQNKDNIKLQAYFHHILSLLMYPRPINKEQIAQNVHFVGDSESTE